MQKGENTQVASAPGQIFLFGEHAVVYGEPALSTAIGLRTRVEAKPNDDNKLVVSSRGFGDLRGVIEKKGGKWKISKKVGDISELDFVTKAIELTFNYLEKGRGLNIEIKSKLPGGSGLGSSSAVTTATIASISSALGETLAKDEILQLAYDSEIAVQGSASRTGVSAATYGGFLEITGDEITKLEEISGIEIVIGYTGNYANTKKMVDKVGELKESRPKIANPLLKTIGKCTKIGIESLMNRDIERVGALMNANQNLLRGLGVSSSELDKLIEAAKSSGAIGAKLTGSGGGGCMIALGTESIDEISDAIREEGGNPIRGKIGVEGLKY